MKYIKKPVPIDAVQWFNLGDHPDVHIVPENRRDFIPARNGATGYIETLEGGHFVTSGDYIITGVRGEVYACKPDIFEETYELVDQA